jgi:hypothetical protein
MQSKAATVEAYLAELPADRRAAVEQVRALIRANLDDNFEEGMQYGMIGFYIPHRIYPPGYHCDPKQPLPFAGIASQKNYLSMYLGCVYGDNGVADKFKKAWAATGKKLDMGKACIRFKKPEDLALDVIADTVKSQTAQGYIAYYEAAIKAPRKGPDKKKVAKKPVKKQEIAKTIAKKGTIKKTSNKKAINEKAGVKKATTKAAVKKPAKKAKRK